MEKIEPDGFDWESLSDDELMQQSDIYEGIVDDLLADLTPEEQKIINNYIEIERELTLREGA